MTAGQYAWLIGLDTLSSIENVISGGATDVLLGSRDANIFWLTENSIDESPIKGDLINGRGGRSP